MTVFEAAAVARRRPRAAGFTLLEMLIVVAIIGIVAAFALPNYTRQMMRTRRADAMDALLQIASEQEKVYLRDNAYTDDLGALGFDPAVSPNGYYSLTLTATDETFDVVAVPNGTPQSGDYTCSRFEFDEQGRRLARDGKDNDTTARCWR